ncbi:MAG: CoA pyrophosphatase [Pseudomonadota bacterium]
MPSSLAPSLISERLQAWLKRPPLPTGEEDVTHFSQIELTPAAVLIPIISREDGLTVLFTQRTSHLTDHAGQISFPGGRAEPEDATMEETALRETEEEIGLPRSYVTLLGHLPEYITRTGFRVTPVVGWAEPGFSLTLDSFEVDEVFEVPLAFLLNPANHQYKSMMWEGQERYFYAMPYQSRNIWGATASMLRSLYMALTDTEKV